MKTEQKIINSFSSKNMLMIKSDDSDKEVIDFGNFIIDEIEILCMVALRGDFIPDATLKANTMLTYINRLRVIERSHNEQPAVRVNDSKHLDISTVAKYLDISMDVYTQAQQVLLKERSDRRLSQYSGIGTSILMLIIGFIMGEIS